MGRNNKKQKRRKNNKNNNKGKKKKKKKNVKKRPTNINKKHIQSIFNNIERIKDDFGETVRNITLSIFRKNKVTKTVTQIETKTATQTETKTATPTKTNTEIKHNIARQRISNFRTNCYKSELLKKYNLLNYNNFPIK